MSDDALVCRDKRRRDQIRDSPQGSAGADVWNGLDYLEIGEDHRILKVYFLNGAPDYLSKDNVRIEGGRRIRNIKVTDVKLYHQNDPERDDYMVVKVDQAGDFSTYTLSLVDLDKIVDLDKSRQTDSPMHRFDPRYSNLEFSFMAGCPSDLDCKLRSISSPKRVDEPEINYLAKDYASFRQLVLDRLALKMPGWTERHIPDIGISIVEMMAYMGDYLSYYQDAVATEAYLNTARLRTSVRRHARLVDYHMHEGCNSRAWVCIETDKDLILNARDIYFIAGNNLKGMETALMEEDLQAFSLNSYQVFEPLVPDSDGCLEEDAINRASLIKWLNDPDDPFSRCIKNELPDYIENLLKDNVSPDTHSNQKMDKIVRSVLCELNRRIHLGRISRSMLEDLYPDMIARPQEIQIYAAHNCIHFYTWGDAECSLQKGATSATLKDEYEPEYTAPSLAEETSEKTIQAKKASAYRYGLEQNADSPETVQQHEDTCACQNSEDGAEEHEPLRSLRNLKKGDILILEELKDPKTGVEGDADPAHRHAVRLTEVSPGIDPLENIPVVEVKWDEADALPFPLYISAIGRAPECKLAEISVARGNVVLVNQGRTITRERIEGSVPIRVVQASCYGEEQPADPVVTPGRFEPCLKSSPLTFRQPLSKDEPASRILRQDPVKAKPQITLIGIPQVCKGASLMWTAQMDLLGCEPKDQSFMVEVNNNGRACLHFGDGVSGKMPEGGTQFFATYVVGSGELGNVGRESISRIVFRRNLNRTLKVRNPLPAEGGVDPESLEDVKRLAPVAFKKNLQRCITTGDYENVAKLNPKVQRAVAALNWTGSWYEVQVAIDPFGSEDLDEGLRKELESDLNRYRRIGYDLKVVRAHYIPIRIALDICVKPDYLRGDIKAALMDIFSNRRLPDGGLGLFHPDNLSFQEAVRLSKLVAAAQAVPGVESVRVTKLERMVTGPNHEIEEGSLPIGPLEIAQMDNDPNLPENGQLILNLEGGR